jgi:hypothetical protein
MAENPYAPPKTEVGTGPDERNPARPGAGARFLWTAVIALPIFMGTVFLTPRENWAYGAIGSVVFAGFSGLIALCIPVRFKVLFIAPSIAVCLFIAYLIGSAT